MLGQKKIPYLAKEPLLKKKRLGYSIFVPYAWYPLKKDSWIACFAPSTPLEPFNNTSWALAMLSFKLLMSKLMYFTLYILNCTHPWHTFMWEYINMSNYIIIKWALFYQIIYIYSYRCTFYILRKLWNVQMCCNFHKKIGLILHNLIEYGHHMNMESPMVLAHSCFGRFTKWFIITLSNLWTNDTSFHHFFCPIF